MDERAIHVDFWMRIFQAKGEADSKALGYEGTQDVRKTARKGLFWSIRDLALSDGRTVGGSEQSQYCVKRRSLAAE